MSRRTRTSILIVGFAMAMTLTPLSAASGMASTHRAVIEIQSRRPAAARLSLTRSAVVRPTLQRPRCHRSSYATSFVGLEIYTQEPASLAYFAFVWCDGTVLFVRLASNKWYGSLSGSASTGGDQPTRIRASAMRLPPGHYRVALITRQPTDVWLSFANRFAPRRVVEATEAIAFDETSKSYQGTGTASSGYASLPLRVPVRSHLALLFNQRRWLGSPAVVGSAACLGNVNDPCVPEKPSLNLNPSSLSSLGGGAAIDVTLVVSPPTGAKTAYFYSGQSGIANQQELLALALP